MGISRLLCLSSQERRKGIEYIIKNLLMISKWLDTVVNCNPKLVRQFTSIRLFITNRRSYTGHALLPYLYPVVFVGDLRYVPLFLLMIYNAYISRVIYYLQIELVIVIVFKWNFNTLCLKRYINMAYNMPTLLHIDVIVKV